MAVVVFYLALVSRRYFVDSRIIKTATYETIKTEKKEEKKPALTEKSHLNWTEISIRL